jgi:hypothetical protein
VSAVELVTAVIAVFFALGIVAGVACVIAISTLHASRIRARRRRADLYSRNVISYEAGDGRPYRNDADWHAPPGPDEDEGPPPPWPGGSGRLIVRSG